MREFIYYSQSARTTGNFGDDLMKAGRIDIACQIVIMAFFISKQLRDNVKLHLVFNGPPDPTKHLELNPSTKINEDSSHDISKKDIAGLIKKLLYKYRPQEKREVMPGYFIEKKRFIDIVGVVVVILLIAIGVSNISGNRGQVTGFVTKSSSCLYDSDGGRVINVKGYIVNPNNVSRWDVCNNVSILREWYCLGNGKTQGDNVICSLELAGSVCYDGACCVPKTCAQLGKSCGTHSNGCGSNINCGTCPSGQSCNANGVCCVPKTCSQLGKTCGSWSDGCTGTLSCGTCPSGQYCDAIGWCRLNPNPNSCNDTDGGRVPKIKGTVSGYDSNYSYSNTDVCMSNSSLLEYYCYSYDNRAYNYTQNCFNVTLGTTRCSDGKCQ